MFVAMEASSAEVALPLRDRYTAFIARHAVAWELTFAALAIVYIVIGFAGDDAPPAIQPTLFVIDGLITGIHRRVHDSDLRQPRPPGLPTRPLGRPVGDAPGRCHPGSARRPTVAAAAAGPGVRWDRRYRSFTSAFS
jgi:hypothetical protein